MSKHELHVIKIGGGVIDDDQMLNRFIEELAKRNTQFILVHGGGKTATSLCNKLDVPQQFVDGRRITDAQTLDVAVMVYAGLINKKIVAALQAKGINAIGLCGADGNLVQARKRLHPSIDYGFVGDIEPELINATFIKSLTEQKMVPVFSSITHNGEGELLNTNADTIARCLGIAMLGFYEVSIFYCFEKKGVLRDLNNDFSVIEFLTQQQYQSMQLQQAIHSGMIPKLDNGFVAIEAGVQQVSILHADQINNAHAGTKLVK